MAHDRNSLTVLPRPAQAHGIAVCLLLALLPIHGQAAETLPLGPLPLGDPSSAGDYSAVECLQQTCRIVGRRLDLIQLLSSSRLRPNGDTTIADLAAIAQEHGLKADTYTDLTMAQLRHASFPAVLRVRGSRYSAKPDHYIVCLGIEDGKARIFNPPATQKLVPLECLATRWTGEALIPRAGDSAANLAMWRYESYLPTTILAATAVVAIGGLRLWRWRAGKGNRESGSPLRIIFQPAGLLVLAVMLSYGCRLALGQGWTVQAATPAAPEGPDPMDFLLKTDAAGAVAEKVAEVESQAALDMHAAGALFVDARETNEFAAGHIKGAMNCPAGDIGHLRLNMAGIPRNRKIAVYCISSHCGKGHYLALTLMQQGYSQVVLYRDGWVKWTGPKEPQ